MSGRPGDPPRALRLAVFTDNFHPELGGIQDSILASARELAARGHRIVVFAPAGSARDYARAGLPVAEPDLGANATVLRLRSLPLPSSSQQSRLALPGGAWRREIDRLRPHLVHTHTFLSVGLQALRAARRAGVPVVGTNHWSVGAFDLYAPLARNALRRAALAAVGRYYQACDRVTGPSRYTIDDLLRHGLRRPCRVVSNPIDTTLFHPLDEAGRMRARQRWRLDGPAIVYAGRLAREKNIDVLIDAFAQVHARQPRATLLLAGHGSARRALAERVRERALAHAVHFVGTLPHADLAELLGAADAFAIASKSETQSMVLLQALACGLPAVGARWGGLTEHLPEQAGRLAAADDPRDFAESLLAVLADEPARRRMGAHARRHAEGFGIAAIADAWEQFYRETLQESARRSTI